MDQYSRGDLVFDVLDQGRTDAPVVVFLHGFPQFNTSWIPIMDRVSSAGYRCIAPNQRGYSPRARPARRRDYSVDELAGDTLALIDALGPSMVHLVGHDWGGTVGWATAARAPERLASLTILSTPHPAAFFQALVTSRQFLASWYMYFFQLPRIPEWFLGRNGGKGLRRLLVDHVRQTPEAAELDAARSAQSGSLTAALNWYRAIPFATPSLIRSRIAVPTLYIWSDGDIALLEKAARNTGRWVSAEYRFEIIKGATHWIPDQRPETVGDLLIEWLAAHPIRAGGKTIPSGPERSTAGGV